MPNSHFNIPVVKEENEMNKKMKTKKKFLEAI